MRLYNPFSSEARPCLRNTGTIGKFKRFESRYGRRRAIAISTSTIRETIRRRESDAFPGAAARPASSASKYNFKPPVFLRRSPFVSNSCWRRRARSSLRSANSDGCAPSAGRVWQNWKSRNARSRLAENRRSQQVQIRLHVAVNGDAAALQSAFPVRFSARRWKCARAELRSRGPACPPNRLRLDPSKPKIKSTLMLSKPSERASENVQKISRACAAVQFSRSCAAFAV